MDEMKIIEGLARVEESTKSAHHRIDEMVNMQNEIHGLALSVNTLAGSVKNFCEDVSKLDTRVKDIEAKPVKRLDQITGYILAALASGIIGYFIREIFGK